VIFVPFSFYRSPLKCAHYQATTSGTFTAGGREICALSIKRVLWHFLIRLADHIARSRAATGQNSASSGTYASQFEKITPGNLFAHNPSLGITDKMGVL
jgi:hypothetical protein